MKLPRRLEALREPNFRRFFIGHATSLLGTGMVGVALSFAVLDLTGSVSDLGLVLAAQTVPLVAFLLVGGVAADRWSRRGVMLIADAARLVTQAILAALLITGNAELWHLLVLQFLGGTATAFFMPAVSGLTPQVVRPELLQEANALRSLASSLGNIGGPAIAGVLVATVGAGWALAVDAASFGVSVVFLASLTLPPREPGAGQTMWRDLRDGWQEFRSRTWLVLANIHAALLNVSTLAPLYVIGPAVAKRYLGGAAAWALISSAFGVGLVVGGFVALAFRPQRPMLTGLGMSVVNVVALALLAVHAPAIAVAPAAAAAGANLSFLNTVWETTLQHEIPPRLLSRVVAYDWLAALVFQPLSYAVVGIVAAHGLGLSGTLWAGSAVAVASTAVVVSLPSIRGLRRPTEPRGAPAGADPPDRAAHAGAAPPPS